MENGQLCGSKVFLITGLECSLLLWRIFPAHHSFLNLEESTWMQRSKVSNGVSNASWVKAK
jgi:hypothetical protein